MKKILTILILLVFSISYAQDIKVITKEIRDSSVQYRYNTSARYPQLNGMKDEKIQKEINKKIYDNLRKGIDAFVKDISDWDLSDIPKDFSSEIDYSYTAYLLNDDIYSFSFDIFCYYAGAAHPNHWSESFNFDLKTGKIIALKDLFKPGIKYLEKISKYCIEDLKKQARFNNYEFDDFMLEDGAGPKDSNFINFNFIEKGLQFTFNPYQVAPYVMGEQYVLIPYRTLYEIMEEKMLDKIPNF